MNNNSTSISMHTVSLHLSMALIICCIFGCTSDTTGQQASSSDKPLDKPATVAQAAQYLNFEKYPLLKDAKTPNISRIASLSYQAPGDVKTAFEFQKKYLTEQNWKELPTSFINDQSASGSFARNGLKVSVMVYPSGDPGMVALTMTNHGNVEYGKLPVPTGAKLLYDMPVTAAFVTDMPVEKTLEECSKLLLSQGWQTYGNAGTAVYFKRNGVRLLANIMAAPAQGGKTVITYSSELLSADLPAPEKTQELRYVDLTKTLTFQSQDTQDNIFSFYLKKLSEDGWKPTTDKPIQIDKKNVLIFRNPTKDMLTLELFSQPDNIVQVKLFHFSSEEIAAMEYRLEEKQKKQSEKKKEPNTILEKEQ